MHHQQVRQQKNAEWLGQPGGQGYGLQDSTGGSLQEHSEYATSTAAL
jgi:hypothetical protein